MLKLDKAKKDSNTITKVEPHQLPEEPRRLKLDKANLVPARVIDTIMDMIQATQDIVSCHSTQPRAGGPGVTSTLPDILSIARSKLVGSKMQVGGAGHS